MYTAQQMLRYRTKKILYEIKCAFSLSYGILSVDSTHTHRDIYNDQRPITHKSFCA